MMNGASGISGTPTKFDTNETDDCTFTVIYQNEKTCQEFVMESRTFSFLRWLKYWIVLNAIAFPFGLHTQDTVVLWCLISVLIVGIFLKVHFKVKKESLLVMSTLGVQVTTTFLSGREHVRFYDAADIKDVIINEGITMHRVIYYLAILLDSKTEHSLVPLFTHSWPRLKVLKQMYQGVQQVLFSTSVNY